MELPGNDDLTNLMREQIVLHPEKFGVMGQYSREMLESMVSNDFLYDMLLVRLTTSVMCGSTISEKPSVVLNLPKNPWQHVKYRLGQWSDVIENKLWHNVGWKNFWLWVPYALALLTGKWTYKRRVKYIQVTADINFEQRVLYPEVNAPAVAGRPVIYETLSVNFPGEQPPYGSNLSSDPSRFYDRHEISSMVYRDADERGVGLSPAYGQPWSPLATFAWLERHGVNVDQLVKRP